MKASHLFSLLLCAALLSLLACKSKTVTGIVDPPPPPGGPVSISFVDTLTYLPGDSAIADGWVTIRNRDGLVVPGAVVTMSIDSFGTLEYLDPAKGDTTNEMGRLNFRFRSYNQTGENILIARCYGYTDVRSFVVMPARIVICHLSISASPDTLWVLPGAEDSSLVSISILDCHEHGVPDVRMNLRAAGGRLRTIPRTDSAGNSQFYWLSNHQYGTFFIIVNAGLMADTTSVTVIDTSQVQF